MGRRPRVVVVVHDIAPLGGMDRALTELIERASDRFDFVVVSTTLAPGLRRLVEWRCIRVPRRPVPLKFALFFFQAALRLPRERADLVCAVGAIVPNRVDVVLAHYCHAGFRRATGALAPLDATPSRRLNTRLHRSLSILAERWCYRPGRVREILAVSSGLAAEIEREFPGVSAEVVPNGVDLDRFSPNASTRTQVRSELGIRNDEVVVLFVGGDWERKGLVVAIDGFAEARRSVAISLKLLVAGVGHKGRYLDRSRAAGVGESVLFLGSRADVDRLCAAADIFVFPSQYEALPLVALEALAAGLPLVATPVNGIDDLFAKRTPGILVERSPEAVGQALARLACDTELRLRLGGTGREIVRAFTWERSVEAVVERFGRLLAETRSEPAERSLVRSGP